MEHPIGRGSDSESTKVTQRDSLSRQRHVDSQDSESDCMLYDHMGPSSRSTTPSPTTHDLVLLADSGAEEECGEASSIDSMPLPTPKRRSSLLKMQRSFGERSASSKGKEGDENTQKQQTENGDQVQISFV